MKHSLIALWVGLMLAGCGETPDVAKEALVKVDGDVVVLAEPDKATFLKVEPVLKDEGGMLHLPGRLVWNEDRTVRVVPQVAGRVLRIQAEVGDKVRSGQGLAVLASQDYGQALADARKAQADLLVSKQAFERNRQLFEAGVIAEKDWQQVQADSTRVQAEATRTSEYLLTLGGDNRGTYVLKTPLAGVVVERNLNPGLEFRPDQMSSPLFVVTDPGSLWIQLDAREFDLAALKSGEKFSFDVKQYPGERFHGVIRHVADFVDPVSRTIKVRGEVANDDRRLKGEMFVTAGIDLPASSALRVPAKAILLMGEKRYVFVELAAGRYLRKEIEAGAERDGLVDVFSGVQAGEKVVVEGNLNLTKFFSAEQNKPKASEK